MKWGKLGITCRPLGTAESVSHCYVPTPVVLKKQGVVRIYYASWDKFQRGRIFYTDFSLDDPTKEVGRSQKPILGLGMPGTFDSDGVSPQFAMIGKGDKMHLLYQGFQRTAYPKINMMLSGLAMGNKKGKMERWATTPFLERTPTEPFIRSAMCLLIQGEFFQAWYTSGLSGWEACNNTKYWDTYPRYDIAYILGKGMADIYNGMSIRCYIKQPNELGVSRPWVIYENKTYKMWFSARSEETSYKIGYAESSDGGIWVRQDEKVGIRSDKVYDREMICFGAVFDIDKNRYMIYNGNDHGRYGAALAILEQD